MHFPVLATSTCVLHEGECMPSVCRACHISRAWHNWIDVYFSAFEPLCDIRGAMATTASAIPNVPIDKWHPCQASPDCRAR
ncbi:hypothetical protein VFPPC_17743 [Pochonia chlamydosporia 170]|uniref:Uncharacterized protein n=1 Tax=Pochonia chlamydosporia 170 TaxID=1380566 RepID=A0A219AQQ2_METCM|nr:hypothetical protein VFPPC_17743 [Pochonia chlamydosporia 170]OWT43081.1 hypothetical protein VFPPC_17743 [Pochonia chlamydosporia 170]